MAAPMYDPAKIPMLIGIAAEGASQGCIAVVTRTHGVVPAWPNQTMSDVGREARRECPASRGVTLAPQCEALPRGKRPSGLVPVRTAGCVRSDKVAPDRRHRLLVDQACSVSALAISSFRASRRLRSSTSVMPSTGSRFVSAR